MIAWDFHQLISFPQRSTEWLGCKHLELFLVVEHTGIYSLTSCLGLVLVRMFSLRFALDNFSGWSVVGVCGPGVGVFGSPSRRTNYNHNAHSQATKVQILVPRKNMADAEDAFLCELLLIIILRRRRHHRNQKVWTTKWFWARDIFRRCAALGKYANPVKKLQINDCKFYFQLALSTTIIYYYLENKL